MDKDEELSGTARLSKNAFFNYVCFEGGLQNFERKHSLNRKGQKIQNSGAGDVVSAEFLSEAVRPHKQTNGANLL